MGRTPTYCGNYGYLLDVFIHKITYVFIGMLMIYQSMVFILKNRVLH